MKAINLDLTSAGPLRKLHINKLNEIRRDAYNSLRIFMKKMKLAHDQGILHCAFH